MKKKQTRDILGWVIVEAVSIISPSETGDCVLYETLMGDFEEIFPDRNRNSAFYRNPSNTNDSYASQDLRCHVNLIW